VDYEEFLKVMEKLLSEGLIEESIGEDGKQYYRLTEKGVEEAEKAIRKSPDAFDFYFYVIARNSRNTKELLEQLLLVIYRVFYNIPYEEATRRAKQWFKGV